MCNVEIRAAFMAAGIKQWELARALGLSETSFSRKLRWELPETEKKRVLSAIEELARKKGGEKDE